MAEPETTPDGRHIVVNGRRWRATDPNIPEQLRAQLVKELMHARRLVKTEGDAVRHRVQDAKVALGERGEPWWEKPSPDGLDERVAATVRALLRQRDGTICPSEAARVVGGEGWRDQMDVVRRVAWQLAHDDVVAITQRGEEVTDPDVRGPIRIARGAAFL